jgi:phosphoglycolate phosphatase-like HAD superfamily hydrolase
MTNNPQQELRDLKVEKEFFIGIDSDGCAFDTMEIKHKECFCPKYIHHWELQKVSKYAREIWEFVNLYSKTRGANRFLALIEAFKLIDARKEVQARHFETQNIDALIEWTKKESKLGNPALEKYADEVNDPVIDRALRWSKAVNQEISEMVYGITPFPWVVDALDKIKEQADAIVVSQTPVEALVREWEENNIDSYVKIIAGQEYGKKSEHLELAAKGKYPDDKILMIGDAPGDMKAAKTNGVLFYPINPGEEEASWKRLHNEALDKFFSGNYAGSYEQSLIHEFEKYLPEKPHWNM